MNKSAKDKKTAMLLAVFFSFLILSGTTGFGQSLSALDQELSQIIDRVAPGVVTVEARAPQPQAPLFPGRSTSAAEPVTAVVGSGLLLDSIGHILTVLHLVDGCSEFTVEIDNRTVKATLVGIDRRLNLAVLKIEGHYRQYLEMSPFPPFVGRMALAYGRVIGRTGYPTIGIIGGKRSDEHYLMSGSVLPGLLGGGVFDLGGRLIGMISSGSIDNYSDNQWGGIVMLPASVVYAAADKIICCGGNVAGYLGVKTSSIELISARGRIMSEAVVITTVEPKSPAAVAGLRIGDVITRFSNHNVATDRELQRLVALNGADKTVNIEFIRGRNSRTAEARLTAFPPADFRPDGPARPLSNRAAIDSYRLQARVDSIRSELNRLQKELEIFLNRVQAP